MGWLMIGAAVVLAVGAAWIIVKHDFAEIEGSHLGAKTGGKNHRLATLGLVICTAGAYALLHLGSDMI